MPIGTIVLFAGASIPAGWLLCDGRVLSRSENRALFNAIGYSYGGARSRFFIPDMRELCWSAGQSFRKTGDVDNTRGFPMAYIIKAETGA